MTQQIRNTLEGTAEAGILKDLADSINGNARAHADAIANIYHAGDDTVIGGASAAVPPTDLPESLLACNELRQLIVKHLADGVTHKTASAEVIAAPLATTQATLETLVNELKADHNTHLTEATVHFNNDAANAIAAADASDLATAITLLTEFQTDWDLHVNGDALSSPASIGAIVEIVDA